MTAVRINKRRQLVSTAMVSTLVLSIILLSPVQALADTFTINGNDPGRTFDGFGAVSGGASTSRFLYDYPDTQRQQILDWLFCSPFTSPQTARCSSTGTYGAALQELKVEIGSDTGSIGAEPAFARTRAELNAVDGAQNATTCNLSRGYEWWLMAQAKARNPNIKISALAWGWPEYIGSYYDTMSDSDPRKPYYKVFGQDPTSPASNDAVDYLTRYVQCAAVNGSPIDYLGMWNEKGEFCSDLSGGDSTCNTSGNWDITIPKWWVTRLYGSLSDWGLSTKIIVYDNVWQPVDQELTAPTPGNCNSFTTQLDRDFCNDTYALGAHYQIGSTALAQGTGFPLWATEDDQPGQEDQYQSTPINRGDWPGAQWVAQALNQNYINGLITKSLNFSAVSSYYDVVFPGAGLLYANQPWSGWYKVQSRIWVMAQTTQFAQPGTWRYITSASCYIGSGSCQNQSGNKGSYVTFRQISGSDWAIVAETINATASQSETFCLTGGLTSTGSVHIWQTNASNSFKKLSDVSLSGGCFTYSLAKDSLYTFTTTTGQVKGASITTPASEPFPCATTCTSTLPYYDQFDGETNGNAPLNFMDMQGAFEVASCTSANGKCVQQVTLAKPTEWWWSAARPAPYSLIGNPTWTNYSVYAGVNTPNCGDSISLWGRLQPVAEDQADTPAHFEFTLTKVAQGGLCDSTHGQWSWRLAAVNYTESSPFIVQSVSGNAAITAWTDATLVMSGSTISAKLSGSALSGASFTLNSTDSSWTTGMAGVSTVTSTYDGSPTTAGQYNGGQFDFLCIGTNPTQQGCQ